MPTHGSLSKLEKLGLKLPKLSRQERVALILELTTAERMKNASSSVETMVNFDLTAENADDDPAEKEV